MSRTPDRPRDPELEQRFREAYERAKSFSASLRGPSLAEQLVELGRRDPAAFETILAAMSPLDLARLAYSWEFHARPKQRLVALLRHRVLAWIAARGIGKSRAAAERVRERIYAGCMAGVLAAPTIEEIERYQIGGKASDAARRSGAAGVVESALRVGLLDVFPPHQRPIYKADKGELHFHTGAVYVLQSAKVPEFRGGNITTAWVEEATKIPRVERAKLFDNIELALRARSVVEPELLVTCTPTADPWVKELVADPGCITILGETEENAANLADDFIERLRVRFGSTRLGRQETKGEILGDTEGAQLAATVSNGRRFRRDQLPRMKRVCVSVDPAISTRRNVDPTGIVAEGRGEDDELYILAAKEGKWTPEEWAAEALDMMAATGAECIVGERNRGGDLVASNVRLVAQLRAQKKKTVAAVKVVEVHATKSKSSRLEELETMGEQGRVHLPEEGLPAYEDQATSWDPSLGGRSPNVLDAAGWGAFYLFDGWGEAPADPRATYKGLGRPDPAPAPGLSTMLPRPYGSGSGGMM